MGKQPNHPIGVALTLFYSVMVLVFFALVQSAVHQHFINQLPDKPGAADYASLTELLANHSTIFSTAYLLGAGFALLFLVLLIRFRKVEVKQHLALQPFNARDLLNWLIVLVAFTAIYALITTLISYEPSDFTHKLWSHRDSTLPLLFTLVIAAPIFEECIFRGFVFSGIQHSHLGTGAAIVVSAAFWAMIHSQHASFELITLFVLGIILAVARIASGSLYVPIVLHAVNNLFAVLTMALFAENVAQ